MTATRSPIAITIVFLLIAVGGGLLIGSVSMPDGWYASLQKPAFQPPNWLFGPVWTVLYVLIGIAGARIFAAAPNSIAFKLWIGQMVLNFLWSPTFFSLHSLGLALAIILVLLATILAFIRFALPIDRPAAWMFVPYALWVGFASLLNGSILILN
jgi:tryptophan-rich sensory protein